MKMGELLSTLKQEQTELKRLQELRKETFLVEKGQKAVISTIDLTQKINEKLQSIRSKKLQIQKTNLSLQLEKMNLAEAILTISDLRNEITELSALKENRRWSLHDEKENKIAQLNALQVEELISKLGHEKTKLDSLIQSLNWRQEL